MKKTAYLSLALVLLLSLIAATAFAQSRTTAFQIQNLGGEGASVSIYYYNDDGSVQCREDVDALIPVGGAIQRNQMTADWGCDEGSTPGNGWRGSVVIESTQPVAVITNVNQSPPYAGGAYDGFDTTRVGSTMVLPFIMSGFYGFNTDMAIQNAGADTATVDLYFYKTGETTYSKLVEDISIEPGASYFRDQATEDTDLAPTWSGVVVIDSDQPVAAEVNENPVAGGLLLNYEGSASGATDKLFMPILFKEFYNFNTAFQLVALENGTAGTIKYYKTGETSPFHSESFSLDQYAALEKNQKFDANLDAGFSYAGVVELTSGSVVAIVNERDNNNKLGLTYSGISSGSATGKLSMPFIIRNYFTYSTAFQILNVGTADDVTITYSPDTSQCPSCSSFTYSKSLGANEALECNQKFNTCLDTGDALENGWVGSVTITADAGGLIVGIVNERGDSTASDTGLVYNAFNY